MPKVLTAAAILAADDLPRELVDVPEWGGAVYVRGLTGTERDQWEDSIAKVTVINDQRRVNMTMINARARLAAMTMIGEDGARLFTDQDVQKLAQKSAAALNRVFTVAQRLSGLTAEDVAELEKNLD
jgi:hypothetical protein